MGLARAYKLPATQAMLPPFTLAGSAAALWTASIGIDGHCPADEPFTAWRAVTIVAITELLFGLVAETPQLPSSARKAFRQFELGPTAPDLQAPLPTQVASAVKLRPEHEYGSSPPTSSRATARNVCRRKRGGREIAQSVG